MVKPAEKIVCFQFKIWGFNAEKKVHIFKNQLTNPDLQVQDKARYLADSYGFILNNMGKYDFPSMESHRSVLDKIRFQLLNYNPDHSARYIKHYARSPFLDKNDEIMKCYYGHARSLIRDIREAAYKDNCKRELLIKALDEFIAELERSLLRNAMEEIQSILHCVEVLSVHGHPQSTDYAVGVIISEFRFTGFQVKDIDRLIDRLLSKDIKTKKRKTISDFPLPASLLEDQQRRSVKDHSESVTAFMEARTLREQFNGISNLYENTRPVNKVLFRVLNLHSKKRISKTYGEVKLTSSVRSYLSSRTGKVIKEFIADHQLYFEVTVNSTNIAASQLLAMDLIRKELPRFETFFEANMMVDYGLLLMKINGEIYFRQNLGGKWLRGINRGKGSIENRLDKLNSKASASFRQLEVIYSQAKTSQLPDQKLNHYWRYLEACKGNEKLKADELINKIADIFANHGLENVVFSYRQIADEVLCEHMSGISNGKIELSYLEIKDFIEAKISDVDWVNRANEIINHPFVRYRSKRMFKLKVKDARDELRLYYHNILFEAYEQRNFIQHSGVFHSMAVSKVLLTLPGLVDRLRSGLQTHVLKNDCQEIAEAVEKLTMPPKWLEKMLETDRHVYDL